MLLEIELKDLQTILVVMGIAAVAIIAALIYLLTELKTLRKEVDLKRPIATDHSGLRLQAYERLTILTDRIALKNLITRLHTTHLSAREQAATLIENIRAEYEHNITQQNYVNPDVWRALTQLKDQNIFIINQLFTTLPATSLAVDLGRLLLEYIGGNPKAELSGVVLDAIQFEVKKLL